jgi:hypothetical protein
MQPPGRRRLRNKGAADAAQAAAGSRQRPPRADSRLEDELSDSPLPPPPLLSDDDDSDNGSDSGSYSLPPGFVDVRRRVLTQCTLALALTRACDEGAAHPRLRRHPPFARPCDASRCCSLPCACMRRAGAAQQGHGAMHAGDTTATAGANHGAAPHAARERHGAPAPRTTPPASPAPRRGGSPASPAGAAASQRAAAAAALPRIVTPQQPAPPPSARAPPPSAKTAADGVTLTAAELAGVQARLKEWEVDRMKAAHLDTVPEARKQRQRQLFVAEALRRKAAAAAAAARGKERAAAPRAAPRAGAASGRAAASAPHGLSALSAQQRAVLDALGLERRAVVGDGRCCWYALAHQLAGSPRGRGAFRDDPDASEALQAQLAAVLRRRAGAWSATETAASWAAEMALVRGSGEYVGDAVVRAAADEFARHVVVLPPTGFARLYPAQPHAWLLRSAAAGRASLSYEFDSCDALMAWWRGEGEGAGADDASQSEEEEEGRGAGRVPPPPRGTCAPMVLLHNGGQGRAAHYESTQPAAPQHDDSSDSDEAEEDAAAAEGDASDEECAPSQHAPGSLGWTLDELAALQKQLSDAGACDDDERDALLARRVALLADVCISGPPAGSPDWPSFQAQVAACIAALRAFVVQSDPVTRGKFVMACGTGKTAVAKWLLDALAQHSGVRSSLVMVPSLQLLRQVLLDFAARQADTTRFPLNKCRIITVCSQPNVHTKKRGGAACKRRAASSSSSDDDDESDTDEEEASEDTFDDISFAELERSLPAGVSTAVARSAAQLAAFLREASSDTSTLVLSTYASSHIVRVRAHKLLGCGLLLVCILAFCTLSGLRPILCCPVLHARAGCACLGARAHLRAGHLRRSAQDGVR